MNVHFLNGQFVTEDKLLISPRDLGYSRGYGVFEFLYTHRGRPFMLEQHIDRLYRSCRSIRLRLPWSKLQIVNWVMQTLKANENNKMDMVIRISISGGPSESLIPAKTPTIIITIDPRITCSPKDYSQGVHVLLSEFQRYEPQAKTSNYVEAVRQLSSVPKDIDEVVYYSRDMIREGTRSNIFAVLNGSLVTPKTKILEGITRAVIIHELQLSVPVEVKDFTVQEFMTASEVFITATGKEVMPVTKVNNQLVGSGVVGPVTKEVMRKYRDFFESDLW